MLPGKLCFVPLLGKSCGGGWCGKLLLRGQGCCCWRPAWILPFAFQRITAVDLAPGLMYFGCSIHGQLDLNEDGLVDLAVGSLGNAVLLWYLLALSRTRSSLRYADGFQGKTDFPTI